jgi:hypothetical protein
MRALVNTLAGRPMTNHKKRKLPWFETRALIIEVTATLLHLAGRHRSDPLFCDISTARARLADLSVQCKIL